MDEQIEDLTPNESPDEEEEPWCGTCHAFSDYRRNILFSDQILTVLFRKYRGPPLHSMRTADATPIHLPKTGVVC